MTERRIRRARLVTCFSGLLVVVSTGALLAGPVWVRPGDLLNEALGILGVASRGPAAEAAAGLLGMRLARVALGILAGAALSVAGVVFQAVLRNPLAEPYVLGVSSGAGLGAGLAIYTGAAAASVWTLPGGAFAGALITMLLVYRLGSVGSRVPIHTLLLAGVVVGAVFGSLLMFLVSVASTQAGRQLHNIIWWLLGNLQISDTPLLGATALIIAAAVLAATLLARDLNLMLLGDEPAAHLGLRVERAKKAFFVLGSLLAGVCVAACGLIGFVGLIVPHTMRMIAGPDHRTLVPCSALAGAIFLVCADAAARTLMARWGTELPIGVVTALLGGPFFIALLRRRRTVTWM